MASLRQAVTAEESSSGGHTYSATVVGTSPTNDVAVLQLAARAGSRPSTSATPPPSRWVTPSPAWATPATRTGTSAATGEVTALDQDITASDGSGTDSEDLTGLIVTSAPIEAGDSGGPLYDAQGQVIGIDTAAQTNGQSGQTVAGYAIPIDTALAVADQIISGVDNATIHQGLPAFLGIQTAQTTGSGFGQQGNGFGACGCGATGTGAPVSGVVSGSAAEDAGITAGSTITAVGGRRSPARPTSPRPWPPTTPATGSPSAWTDASGSTHTAGPGDLACRD